MPDAGTVNMRAPVNQFAHARAYPTAEERDVVRYNFDTLYSFAWLDVSSEPVVVSVPDTRGRYYMLPLLDMWTDVFAMIGSCTTGNAAGSYAVVAPNWNGALPEDVVRITAPTSAAWLLGRTQTNGPADYENVHKVQDGYQLTPLSRWGRPYAPPADAFWSVTMYDKDGFQVPNPLNRFAIGDRDQLAFGADGSLEIYVQADSPGREREANWLPAPRDEFQPTMRIYSPRQQVLDGTWSPPPFTRVG